MTTIDEQHRSEDRDRPQASRSILRILPFIIWTLPTVLILQPLFPSGIQSILLWIRLGVFPLLAVWLLPKKMHWISMLVLLGLVFANGYSGLQARPAPFMLNAICIFGGIALFRSGRTIARKPEFIPSWEALVHGTTVFNLITIAVLIGVVSGRIQVGPLAAALQRETDLDLFRFALGNAIEVPFVVTAILYAGLRCSSRDKPFLFATTCNLVTAVIAQSRIVLLAALLIFIGQWIKSSKRDGIISGLAIVILLFLFRQTLTDFIGPIMARYNGNDYGSSQDRMYLFRTVLDHIQLGSIFIGHGLTSSAFLMEKLTGMYRSVESLFFEMLFELGIVGMLLGLISMFDLTGRDSFFQLRFKPVVWMLWAELLLFMPVFSMLPLVLFALGALTDDSPQLVQP